MNENLFSFNINGIINCKLTNNNMFFISVSKHQKRGDYYEEN